MARVKYLDSEDMKTPEAQAAWQRLETERPKPIGAVFRLTAHSPALLGASLTYGQALRADTVIEDKLRELAILTVAHATGVEYAIAHHSGPAVLHGATEEQIGHVLDFETSDAFDERERAVMRLAYESTVNVRVSQETWNAAAAFLDERELVELVFNIAYYNNGARIMAALDVELEEPYKVDPVGQFLKDIKGRTVKS
ncbi:carboxymuconolactone decarboxylase family protein [Streptomyces sp. NPDC058614]|uniref:carboxymuconolactone decarboxylase family protein n=1 Tax=Streptomyces sp. NPDC058614 TaxID=3346557 RepID=UPI003658288A